MTAAEDRIAAPGTAEERWAAWLPGVDWPVWTPDPAWTRVAVCAAHPDDEVLGVGGVLALLATAGVQVDLVAVTDGEGSHPGSTVLTPTQLAGVRTAETAAALAALGVPARVVRLGLPDSGLAGREPELTALLADAVRGCDAVLAPWTGDAHPDHEAVGRAAVAAGSASGTPVWQYLVWAWHWATPGDARVPWATARTVALPAPVQAAKRAAVACFGSQVRPLGPAPADRAVLPPDVLAHFDRDREVLFR
ncbi:N-acetylglucosaminyl phosphatidylinositol deacetylase [Modestobacter italicus]|uniref:N-acetylglucosaminyl phosphatidylinositol deacetylase n=1 Tax=Modestobacter italicus (strain DSM 44449 / CECT 9708 / BC 501) TaxID=2732864 RepID=I4EZS1_MODI5|nr:PIG-L family deacetylase [Modestobacter marinus]CCH88884.1 N-acetylglucosaminyl phosphatidylinositol deacetylase [Modestobacter marinus]